MAFSIESRVPFLTLELASFALSLPEEHLIGPRGTTKRVFREAMRGIVPDDVLNRRDKIAFTTPEASWLQSLRGWIDGVLASETARSIPALRDDFPRSSNEAGIRAGAIEPGLWRYLNTIKWAERFEVSFG